VDTRPSSWTITRLDLDLQRLDACEIEAGEEGSPSVSSVLMGVLEPVTAVIGTRGAVFSDPDNEGAGIEEGQGICVEFVIYHTNAHEIATESVARWIGFFDVEVCKVPMPQTLI